jgi:hypothetical protein
MEQLFTIEISAEAADDAPVLTRNAPPADSLKGLRQRQSDTRALQRERLAALKLATMTK